MTTKTNKKVIRELTPDEIKKINREVAITVTWYVLKRILLIPVLALAFVICLVLGVSTNQISHTLSGEHNVREQN